MEKVIYDEKNGLWYELQGDYYIPYSLNVPVIMAGLVVVTLPMIIVYIFGQKKLVQGLMSGAVKE